jgi:Tol biopolymer transport system component/serine/threonine protein kinase
VQAERFKQIDALLDAVFEKDASERAAFLDAACAGDDELRAEIESLLAAHGRAENFIEQPAMEVVARAAAQSAAVTEVGRRVGSYKILSLLGAGGMGEVYLAEDARLNRRVALKLLPAGFTKDPERVRRFEHEARAASALNHPNIVTIHEVGQSEGTHFIATEYVEGRTLRRLIADGEVRNADALNITAQVAEALAAAHAAGIIHRDIKPENIMLRPDGYAKVLDFGIAKLTERASAPDGVQHLSEAGQTETGAVVGTVAYMSPEQALGQKVDHRTDVFSLGVILYEMLTGEHPFRRATNAATFDRILNHHPPTPRIPDSDAAPELERVVCRALEKDRELRHQTASDLRAELKRLQRALDSSSPVSDKFFANAARPRPTRSFSRRTLRLVLASLLIVVAVLGGYFALLRPVAVPAREAAGASAGAHFNVVQLTDQPGQELYPSLSPDGKAVIYAVRTPDDWDIYWQRVGGNKPLNLTENSPADDTHPALSPDGEYIVFRSEREKGGLFIMGATGESARRLTDFGFYPSWSSDGREVAFSTEGFTDPNVRRLGASMIWIVNVSTGEQRQLTDEQTGDAAQPAWSPSGARIAYWGRHKGGQRDIWTIPARGQGEPVRVTDDAAFDWNPVWSPDGKFLYFASDRGGSMNLWRVPLEEQTGIAKGPPEPLTTPASYAHQLAFSRDGRRAVYVNQVNSTNIFKVGFNPYKETITGQPVAVTQGSRHASAPNLSPDGELFVYSSQGEKQEDLYVVGKDGAESPRKLTDDIYKDRSPRWSPDGTRIVFYSDRSGRYEAWMIRPDGSDLKQITFTEESSVAYPFWSPDGTRLAYNRHLESCAIIEVGKPWNEQTPYRLLDHARRRLQDFWANSWSPDGRKLGGWSSPDGKTPGIVIYDLESGDFEWVTDFGYSPVWLRDNRRLIFNHLHQMYIVNTETKKSHELLPPSHHRISGYGLSPDNRMLYYGLTIREADVWMLNLD